jgi:hypothetical protein
MAEPTELLAAWKKKEWAAIQAKKMANTGELSAARWFELQLEAARAWRAYVGAAVAAGEEVRR